MLVALCDKPLIALCDKHLSHYAISPPHLYKPHFLHFSLICVCSLACREPRALVELPPINPRRAGEIPSEQTKTTIPKPPHHEPHETYHKSPPHHHKNTSTHPQNQTNPLPWGRKKRSVCLDLGRTKEPRTGSNSSMRILWHIWQPSLLQPVNGCRRWGYTHLWQLLPGAMTCKHA